MFYFFFVLVLLVDLYFILGLAYSWSSNLDDDTEYEKKRREFGYHIVSTETGSKDYLQQITDSLIQKTNWFSAQFDNRSAYSGQLRLYFFLAVLANAALLIYLIDLWLTGELHYGPIQSEYSPF